MGFVELCGASPRDGQLSGASRGASVGLGRGGGRGHGRTEAHDASGTATTKRFSWGKTAGGKNADNKLEYSLEAFKMLNQMAKPPFEVPKGKLADTLSSQDEFVKEGFTQVNATSLKAYVMSQIDNVNSDQESDFETGGEDEDEDHAFGVPS